MQYNLRVPESKYELQNELRILRGEEHYAYVNLGLSRVRTRAILNRHEATLYGGGHALYNAVQTEFPFYAFFVAVHGVQGNFQGRCNL